MLFRLFEHIIVMRTRGFHFYGNGYKQAVCSSYGTHRLDQISEGPLRSYCLVILKIRHREDGEDAVP